MISGRRRLAVSLVAALVGGGSGAVSTSLGHAFAAEPLYRLRIATIAPEGTAWARLGHAFERDVARDTHEVVHARLIFGGVAGTDHEAHERIRRDQLDGIVGGSAYCESLSPSMRGLAAISLFRSRQEWSYTVNRLRELFDGEMAKSGFVNLGVTTVGPILFMSRRPVRTLDDLRHLKLWVWDMDDVRRQILPRLGISVVTSALGDSPALYDEGRIDAFLAAPIAALALQWHARARYFTDLRIGYQPICFVVAQRAMDALPLEAQLAVRADAAKMVLQIDAVGAMQDDQLLGGLFQSQGVQSIPVTAQLRQEFADAARTAQIEMGDSPVPRALLARVEAVVVEFRASHVSKEAP